jgi:hypothetical protein
MLDIEHGGTSVEAAFGIEPAGFAVRRITNPVPYVAISI